MLYPDPALYYPFEDGDTADWIANGLFLAGYDVRCSARPPLFPFLIAVLYRAGLLGVLAALVQLATHLTTLGLYFTLARRHGRAVGGMVAAWFLLGSDWQRLSFTLMADVPASCLLAWALLAWLAPEGAPRYVLAGFFAGLSAVTQPVALLFALPAAGVVIAFDRSHLRSPRLWIGAALFVAPALAWRLYRSIALGFSGDVLTRHWSLIELHGDALGFYLWSFLALVGIPAALLAVSGLWSLLRRMRQDPAAALIVGALASILVFFIFLYGFASVRFLSYVVPLTALCMGESLSRAGRRCRWLFGMAAILFVACPTPGSIADAHRVSLWPAPMIWAEAGPGRGPSGAVGLQSVSLVTNPRLPWEVSNYALLERTWRKERPTREFDPSLVGGDRSALLFYSTLEEAPARSQAIPLGNLLHKQVGYLPASVAAALSPLVELESVGGLAEHVLYRARVADVDDRWIFAARAGSVSAASLRRRALDETPAATIAGDDLAVAEALASALEGRHIVIYASTRGLHIWQALVPLLLRRTPEVVVVEPERASDIKRTLGSGKPMGEIAGVPLAEHRLFDWDWVVLGER